MSSKKRDKNGSFSGDPDDLTDHQRDRLKQFRTDIGDIIKSSHSDRFLIKWLKARKFDVKKAEEMYRKSMAWRAEVGADTILEDFEKPEIMRLFYPGGLFGEDKDGRPVWIDPLGAADIHGILFSVKKSDIIKTMIYNLEYLHKEFGLASTKHGRPIDQCLHIVDMTGFGSNLLWKPALDLYIDIVRMLEDNYPEILRRTYLINAPRVFKAAYNIFKSFIDEGTASKFALLGANWHDDVFRDVDPSQLPEYYGGTQTDPGADGKCLSRLCYGGKVPEKFYRKKEEFFSNLSTTKTESIGRNGKLVVHKDICKEASLLRWMFATDSGTVFFSVHRDSEDGEQKTEDVIVSRKEIECHRIPEDGHVVCMNPGKYSVVFENDATFSSRKLTHAISVIEDEVVRGYLGDLDSSDEILVNNF